MTINTHITKFNICSAPSVLGLRRKRELSNKFLISIGTNINMLPTKTYDKIERQFSTYRTLKSSDESKLAEKLRLEKYELYTEHIHNSAEMYHLLRKNKNLCHNVDDNISKLIDPKEESKNNEINRLGDYHYDKDKVLNGELNDAIRRNIIKPSPWSGELSDPEAESGSESSIDTIDSRRENIIRRASRAVLENMNKYTENLKDLFEDKKSENPKPFRFMDRLFRKQDKLNENYKDFESKQSDILDKYKSTRDKCLQYEMSEDEYNMYDKDSCSGSCTESGKSKVENTVKRSIIDDYADVSQEMPDYNDPDA